MWSIRGLLHRENTGLSQERNKSVIKWQPELSIIADNGPAGFISGGGSGRSGCGNR
jgi:hypothetical protein